MNLTSNKTNAMQLNTAIFKGIDFLAKNQLNYGEFQSYMSPSEDINENCRPFLGSSPYITTFILYSLSFVDSPQIHQITEKALDFLQKEAIAPGIWSFFTTNRRLFYANGKLVKGQGGIVPDLDDTSCVSFALKQHGIAFADNREIILHNRNEEGLFYTWLLEERWRKNEKGFTIPSQNDICCGVNANVLLYLGENENTQAVCHYLNEIILSDREDGCRVYFPDRLVIYYLISRAYFNGITSLKLCRDSITSKILSLHKNNGSFGDVLSTALAVCTLLNFEVAGLSSDRAVEFLLARQKENGSWSKSRFFISTASHYGSEELTTAICLEALQRSENVL
jgi:hypothetical protein